MEITRDEWEVLAPLSGEKVGEMLGIDGGSARKLIRRAKKDKALKDLPWYQHAHQTPEVVTDTDEPLHRFGLIPPPKHGPAILLYDIETAPALCYVWGQFDQNVIATEQDWYLLSFAYKWLNSDKVGFVPIFQSPDFYPDTTNDKHVVERLAALFDRADVLVAHNGDKFDRRKSNQRFLYWDIDPPSPYQTIDTLALVRKEFSHYSNALKELGRVHELGDKTHHTGFEMWRECMRGDAKFWKTMEKYNRQDVLLLEKLYIKILPWMGLPGRAGHPNHGFWAEDGKMVCPNCGHDHLVQKGTHRTNVSEFDTYQCERCRSFSRFRKRRPQTNGGVQLV